MDFDDPVLGYGSPRSDRVSADGSALPPVSETMAAMLRIATVRLEILLGRMSACDGDHEISKIEVPGWIEEQQEFLARAALRDGPPGEVVQRKTAGAESPATLT